MFVIINKILKNHFGAIIISIILGLGLASLFRKVCKDKMCMNFKGPVLNEIKDSIYKHANECYIFTENSIKCGKNKERVNFA